MPVYDYLCPCCHSKREDEFVHNRDEKVKCPRCGAVMKRLFPGNARCIGIKVFPSEGIFLEHVTGGARRFYSEKEMRQHEKDTGDTIARLH